jgi:hypothetical protein
MITACAAMDAACTGGGETAADDAETIRVAVDTPAGVVEVDAVLEDGLAIVGGDMVIGTEDDARAAEVTNLRSAGRRLASARWPNGVVPYELDPSYSSAQRQAIFAAMQEWYLVTPYRFVPHTSEADYVYFLDSDANNSSVGRVGGKQYVRVAGTGPGLIEHEIGHALGLWHEHQRADRDSYVVIHWENVLANQIFDFQTYEQLGVDGRDMFPYDFGSIMGYGSYAFSANHLPTITKLDGSTFAEQRNAPSDEDIWGAVRLLTYSDGQTTYEVASAATGRALDVQAASYLRDAPINNYTWHDGDNQRWIWWYVPWANSYLVINKQSGMCLDYRALVAGTRVAQEPCDGSAGQRWQFDGGRLHSYFNASWCVQARADWTATIEPCDGQPDQQWAWSAP